MPAQPAWFHRLEGIIALLRSSLGRKNGIERANLVVLPPDPAETLALGPAPEGLSVQRGCGGEQQGGQQY